MINYEQFENNGGFVDNWKRKILDNFPNVPKNDVEIHKNNPNIRWLYDKKILDEYFGFNESFVLNPYTQKNYENLLEAYCLPNQKYVIKPLLNLRGMSANTYFANNLKEILHSFEDILNNGVNTNYVILKFYEGEYYTLNLSVFKGKITNYTTYKAITDENSSFQLFYSNYALPEIVNTFAEVVEDGFYCIEVKGDKIFDAHNRLSCQFWDLDKSLFDAWNTNNPEIIVNKNYSDKFSRVYRLSKDCRIWGDINFEKYLRKGVTSINLCFDEGFWLSNYFQDRHSYRYMYINGYDLLEIEKTYSEINKLFIYEI